MRALTLPAALPLGWKSAAVGLLLLLTACGSGASSAPPGEQDFLTKFSPGPIVFAVEADIELMDQAPVESVTFTVRTKPGYVSEDVRVTYTRAYLNRTNALDEEAGTLRVPIFGLYADYDNQVTIEVAFLDASLLTRTFTVSTPAIPPDELPPPFSVETVATNLGMSFLLLQGFRAPTVFDIDGEVRWQGPDVGEMVFPRACTPDGFVVGSPNSNAIHQIDWLGRSRAFTLSEARYAGSHHNLERGKTGLLNTVTVDDGIAPKPLSVLAEMTDGGVVTREWDFDEIFQQQIESHGEDALLLVKPGENWFHMNSAIYDASDDSVIASSRENFVVKADYETGAIKWILGNPDKIWYRDFPKSLQPLALQVAGDPPIGQHALSISPDGEYLMLFNNGKGNGLLEDVGDTRTYSKVSVYRIDAAARRAQEVWSYDFDGCVYSPVCSSAYWTARGNVLAVCSTPQDGSLPRLLVVNEAKETLFEATIDGKGCGVSYAAEEILLGSMILR